MDKPLNVESIKEILKGFGDQSALLSKFVFNKLQSAGLIDKDGQLIGSPELVQEFIETHSLPSQFSEQAHSDESTDNESNATNSASEHNETKSDSVDSAPVIVQGEVLAATTENSDKDTTSEDVVSVSLISSDEAQEIYDRYNIVEDSEIENQEESSDDSSDETTDTSSKSKRLYKTLKKHVQDKKKNQT